MTYIELHARSAFSFLEGASVPEELVAAALALEMPAMALLDRDGFYGSPRFHLSAKKNGIKAHIGAEITVQSHDLVQSPKSKVKNKIKQQTLDFGHWTLDKNTQVTKEKRSHYLSSYVIAPVIKISVA
jgi:DNA polymerase III alpha subunit